MLGNGIIKGENKINEIGHKYGIEINIKKYPMNIFKKEMDSDPLIREVVENHVIINGIREFVGGVVDWTR